MSNPNVFEVAVVAMPHEKWGEVPCAFVILKPNNSNGSNENITEDLLINWCKSRLASFKLPKKVIFLNELPKTSTGKVQKNVLRNNLKYVT